MSEIKRLKKEIAEKEAERNQAKGSLATIEKSWKEDHGLESKEEVEDHVAKLDKKIKKLKDEYEDLLESVKEKLDEMD